GFRVLFSVQPFVALIPPAVAEDRHGSFRQEFRRVGKKASGEEEARRYDEEKRCSMRHDFHACLGLMPDHTAECMTKWAYCGLDTRELRGRHDNAPSCYT